MTRTSSISGTFVNRQRSPVSVAAASSFRAAFFAPLIDTVPVQRPPALDRKISRGTGSGTYSQWNGRGSTTGLIPDAADPPGGDARRRGAEECLRVTPERRPGRPASREPPSRARSASRRRLLAFSRSISHARSAVSAMTTTLSGRTWRNPPRCEGSSPPPFRMRSSPTAEHGHQGRGGAAPRARPRCPAGSTASTASL